MAKHRILTIAHGHPDFSKGGGEIAAYNLYKSYSDANIVEESWFLARHNSGKGCKGNISKRRKNEYLWDQCLTDWFMLKGNINSYSIDPFTYFLKSLQPTVVHFHHYIHMGIEFIRLVKQVLPDVKILLTLHEYIAICANNGQMVKTGSMKLCSSESPDECIQCFPDRSTEQFWLRKQYLLDNLSYVDLFISPSEFLKNRYVDWGIPEEQISVIENGQNSTPKLAPRGLTEEQTRSRFAFFGQINPYKGVDLLLEAANLIPNAERKNIRIEIHGANLESQTQEFQEKLHDLASPLIKKGILRFIGPYELSDLENRMRNIDWVVIPSIWWENSPMVIQEAFSYGRPIICSDIGGMAEKVSNRKNGLHFSARNAYSLAQVMNYAASKSQWEVYNRSIKQPMTYNQCAARHLVLIKSFSQ